MTKQVYWGIDVSKDTLDVSIQTNGQELFSFKIQNAPSKIRMAISHWMCKNGLSWEHSIFCMESTGIYTSHLLRYLCSNCEAVYVVNPHHLKKSMGLIRGKSDKIDAKRIARFIAKNHDDLQRYDQPEEDIVALKALQTKRKMYLRQITQISVSTKQYNQFGIATTLQFLVRNEKSLIKQLRKAIKEIDLAIRQIINANSRLKAACKLISSVPGVGPVLSVAILIATRGFTRLTTAKQLGCYCGVVPFEHSSGTSIRGKNRVSGMADKYLKTILHMASMRAVRLRGELQDYYHRKLAEGKNKMLILNAVRNKIVMRVCAVIRNQKEYQQNLVLS